MNGSASALGGFSTLLLGEASILFGETPMDFRGLLLLNFSHCLVEPGRYLEAHRGSLRCTFRTHLRFPGPSVCDLDVAFSDLATRRALTFRQRRGGPLRCPANRSPVKCIDHAWRLPAALLAEPPDSPNGIGYDQ